MTPTKIGRYEILKQIGEGGMAVVFLAHDPRFDREVALKMMSAELLARNDPSFRLRFQREAKMIAALEHPAIVPVYDFGEKNSNPYLVMRYMAGGSLEERLRAGVLTIEETARIVSRLAPALDQAHRKGIIHRDLKPGNILFDLDDEPYVSDFGMAKLTTAHTPITISSLAIGTPAYMSPEQIQGDPNIDGRSDIYSLGAILYQMLCGVIPYQATTPAAQIVKHVTEPVPDIRTRRPDLPVGIQMIIACAMAKDKEARFRTVSAMALALEAVVRQANLFDAGINLQPEISHPSAQPAGSIPPQSPIHLETVHTPTPPPTAASSPPLSPSQASESAQQPSPLSDSASLVQPPAEPAQRSVFAVRKLPWVIPVILVTMIVCLILVVQIITRPQAVQQMLAMLQPPAATSSPSVTAAAPSATASPSHTATLAHTVTITPTLIPPSITHTVTSAPTTIPTASQQISSKDGMIVIFVPAGEFDMGSDPKKDSAGWKDEMPLHTVGLDAFLIDQTEVTNAMYARCVQAGVCEAPEKFSSYHIQNYYSSPDYANYPVVYSSWFDAQKYCEWAGGRLPTEAEWEKSARGADQRLYPWGDNAPDVSRANYNGVVNDTTPAGSYPAGASFYGALDMAGNVWEWVQDNYREDYYSSAPLKNPQWLGYGLNTDQDRNDYRVIRGGNFLVDAANLRAANRQKSFPVTHFYDIGFRCVR